MMLEGILLAALLGSCVGSLDPCKHLYSLKGDFMVGGLFPVHYNNTGSNGTMRLVEQSACKGLSSWGYTQFQAMRLAVEEINNSSALLPNLTLGYYIWHSCNKQVQLQAIFHLVSDRLHCCHAGFTNKIIAVVGPDKPDMTQLAARIFTFYKLPQISYSAKDKIFGDKNLFPFLFRMMPDENRQILGFVSLLEMFAWQWVSAVGSSSKASQQAIQVLIREAQVRNICISYQGVMTANVVLSENQLRRVVQNIDRAKTNVTIVFGENEAVEKFFNVVIELKITGRVWIAPETWVLTHSIAQIPGIGATGTFLGLTIKPVQLPQFPKFVKNEPQSTRSSGAACVASPLLAQDSLAEILSSNIWHWSFYSYAMVYALAHALHELLGCSLEGCQADKEFEPWQISEMLQWVNFPLQNHVIQFSSQRDFFLGYDVITWAWTNGTPDFRTIGSYTSRNLTIDSSQIRWATTDGQAPQSACITVCTLGQIRSKQLLDECSCLCEDCLEGTYQNQTDADVCLPCPSHLWSPQGSSQCFPPRITYPGLEDTNIFALTILAVVGFFLLCGCLLVFAANHETPVVKAAGGKLAFMMLASLLVCCATTSFLVGRPTPVTCLIRQPLFALSFTLCVSCLLVRAFQIVFIFKMATRLPHIYRGYLKYRGTYAFVGLSSAVQLIICSLWFYFSPPKLKVDFSSTDQTFLHCTEGHFLGLAAVLGYIMLLGGGCFVFAFMGRNLPKHYSETRLLTLSMLLFLMGWGCFMLLYITTEGKGMQLVTLQMFTVQVSIYGILCTYFIPKCYVILFQPQYNTVAHFQSCIQSYTTTTRSSGK